MIGVTFDKFMYITYFPFKYDNETFSFNILKYFLQNAESISKLRNVHSLMLLYGTVFIGSVLLLLRSVPLGVFPLIWLLCSLFINNEFLFKFIAPAQVFAYIIGFEKFFMKKGVKKLLPVILVAALAQGCVYASGEIGKANVPKEFWIRLMNKY